jgi:chromosome segregation protein
MKLTALEIHGFKSFADRVRLTFDQGVTGVVGPNGCGKSNIVDAMRWVLGEQRTRNLRSDKMENVIFNGTAQRRQANLAEVTITFENTRNLLPTEYSTVAITRRLFRDGDSEYLLNDVPCRLKDIQGLLLDTGIGPDSYAMIELGMIDELLQDRNGARRLLFEEAAGIARYKRRKRETLQRLEDVDHNLERVEDVLFEIQKNIKSLEKQAKRAEQYLKLKANYKLHSSRLAYLKIGDLTDRRQRLQAAEQGIRDQLLGYQTDVHKHESRIEVLQKELADKEKALAAEQRVLNTHVEAIQKLEYNKGLRNEKINFARQREEAIGKQLTENALRAEQLERQLGILADQIAESEAAQARQQQQTEQLATEHKAAQEALQAQRRVVDELALALRQTERELQALVQAREVAQAQRQRAERELARTTQEQQSRAAEITTQQDVIQQRRQRHDELLRQVEALRKQKQEAERAIEATQSELEALRESTNKTRVALESTRKEYDLTKSLVENLEGFPESVRFLKKQLESAEHAALLSDVFSTDEQYRIVVENFLEPYINYYVVNQRADALAAIELLRKSNKGRANFFVLREIAIWLQSQSADATAQPSAQGPLRPLLDLVDFSPVYLPLARYLFQRAWLAQGDAATVEAALQSLPTSSAPPVVLDASGSLVLGRLTLSGGSVGLFQGKRIGRARNLEKLGRELERLKGQLETETQQQAELKAKLDQLRASLPNQALQQAERELGQEETRLTQLETQMASYQQYIERVGTQTVDLQGELEKLQAELDAKQAPIAEAQTALQQAQAALSEAQLALNTHNDNYNRLNQQYNAANLELVQATNRLEGLRKDQGQLQNSQRNQQQTRQQLQTERQQIAQQLAELEGQTGAGEDDLVASYAQRREMEEKIGVLEEGVIMFRTGITEHQNALRELARHKDAVNQQIADNQEARNQVELQLSSIAERLGAEFQIDVQTLDEAELFADQARVDWQREFPLNEVETEVLKLRDKLSKFGEVNPMAVEAYEEATGREKFILTQREDLAQAKADLLTTIRELDDTARTKFMEAFTTIRENFIRVFRTLFTAEDTCDLRLANEDDPLESAIEIIARPKGKRPLTIAQLSGGEKTLTATALLFAIYLFRPAPFCVFDEVDAPLDDANIDKFNRLIQEFARETQFLIVTHNKRTMVQAHVLYGVTMDQPGISRLLPVSLQDLKLEGGGE